MIASDNNDSAKSWRSALKRVPVARQVIPFVRTMQSYVLDNGARSRATFDNMFAASMDPFQFRTIQEQDRFSQAMQMLDSARKATQFNYALEIGCAEGMFTLKLGPLCHSLLAVDCSQVALTRARQRCASLTNLEFQTWDLRSDVLDRSFDLIVLMGVLEYVRRPAVLREAITKVLRMLTTNGFLLVGTTVQPPQYQNTWLGRKLLLGTNIHDYLTGLTELQLCSKVSDKYLLPFEHALFRKK